MSFPSRRVRIESPARLHLGFVDLNGDLGRRFGSLGLALDDLSTTVQAERAARFSVVGDDIGRAQKYAERSLQAFGLPPQLALRVGSEIPAHAGLGSGTQLALAIAAAIAELFDLDRDIRDLAELTGRGRRSGIGVGVFEAGGFVFDGGHAQTTAVPPLLCRFEFPQDWRVILICDSTQQGLNGSAEVSAFETLQPMQRDLAAELCRVTLMGVFPALVERAFATFSRHIAAIQAAIGEYFSPCQGGPYTSPDVAAAIEWVTVAHGLVGVGQTSWGPTGFAFVENAAQAQRICAELADRYTGTSGLSFTVHRGRNRGADIALSAEKDPATVASG